MKITIEIDDKELEALVADKIASELADETLKSYGRSDRRKGTEKAVREIVYANKDEIVQLCVERASKELVRKGLPKLLEKGAIS